MKTHPLRNTWAVSRWASNTVFYISLLSGVGVLKAYPLLKLSTVQIQPSSSRLCKHTLTDPSCQEWAGTRPRMKLPTACGGSYCTAGNDRSSTQVYHKHMLHSFTKILTFTIGNIQCMSAASWRDCIRREVQISYRYVASAKWSPISPQRRQKEAEACSTAHDHRLFHPDSQGFKSKESEHGGDDIRSLGCVGRGVGFDTSAASKRIVEVCFSSIHVYHHLDDWKSFNIFTVQAHGK